MDPDRQVRLVLLLVCEAHGKDAGVTVPRELNRSRGNEAEVVETRQRLQAQANSQGHPRAVGRVAPQTDVGAPWVNRKSRGAVKAKAEAPLARDRDGLRGVKFFVFLNAGEWDFLRRRDSACMAGRLATGGKLHRRI